MNSNLNEVTSLFDQKEQELRQLASQRAKQLEQLLVQKEKKLKEQDLIIRAQMDKISQIQSEVTAKEQTCQEYEQRFQLLRDAVEQQSKTHSNEIESQKQDMLEWVHKYQLLEEKLQNFATERSEILSQLKDANWAKDQEQKRSQRELQQLQDRLNIDKQNFLKQIEVVKTEIQDRHASEMQSRNSEALRTENLLTDRISLLEKEVGRLQLISMQQNQVEADLRAKCDALSQKNEKLRLELFSSNDLERKHSIELQMSVQEMRQELETRENFTMRQIQEMQNKLQSTILEKERLNLEKQQAEDKLKHQEVLFAEKIQIEVQRVRGTLDRQLQSAHQAQTELNEERQNLLDRISRLTQQAKDKEFENRRELFALQKRQEETESSFDHQGREFRAQIAMKSKEIINLNEQVHDLTLRLDSKSAELKHCKSQMLKWQSRNEDLQKDLEVAQLSAGDFQKRVEDEVNDAYQDQVQHLQTENQQLRQTIQQNQAQLQQERSQSRQFSQQKESQEVVVEGNDFISNNHGPFSETQQLPQGVFSPILTQQIHQSDDYKMQNDAQDRQIQALLQHNETVTNMLNQLTTEHHELKRKYETEQEQIMELRRALFKTQGQVRQQLTQYDSGYQIGSVDMTKQSKAENALIDKLGVLNDEIKRLQAENIALKTKLVEQDRLVQSLKQERDQLLDISQNLKVKLTQSEKKILQASGDKIQTSQKGIAEDKRQIDRPKSQNELNYLNTVMNHLRSSQIQPDIGPSRLSPLEEPELIQNANSQHNFIQIQQLIQQRLSDIPGFENFQPNMQMFEQSMLSALSEHLNKSRGYAVSPGQMSAANIRRSTSSVLSNNQSHVRQNSDINESSSSDYTRQPKSTIQIRNQTFGPNSSAFSATNQDLLSPGMQEEGIANIAITNDFVQKAKQAAKVRLQELKQTYIMDKANDIFPVRDDAV